MFLRNCNIEYMRFLLSGKIYETEIKEWVDIRKIVKPKNKEPKRIIQQYINISFVT